VCSLVVEELVCSLVAEELVCSLVAEELVCSLVDEELVFVRVCFSGFAKEYPAFSRFGTNSCTCVVEEIVCFD